MLLLLRRQEAWDVVVAEDGQRCVEAWSDGGIDLILMDVQMPVLDGIDATREIRRLEAERGLKPTKIVALTATLPENEEACRAAGMDDFLAKPVRVDRLLSTLERYLPPRR